MTASSARREFPNLRVSVHEKPLVYLDNAATTFRPQVVLDRILEYESSQVSNVHRGAHALAESGTEMFENARKVVAQFIGSESANEIIWTRNTTESLNCVAHILENQIDPGDEIVISQLEHHSNIIPWQLLAERRKATLRWIPLEKNGTLSWSAYKNILNEKTKIVSLSRLSNVLGSWIPVDLFFREAKKYGAYTVCDAAQSVSHEETCVRKLGCDFLAFSGHKLFAPAGIGVLYGRAAILEKSPPFLGGGSMIDRVSIRGTTWADIPHKFEAGTPNVAGAVALATAIDFWKSCSSWLHAYELELKRHTLNIFYELDEAQLLNSDPDIPLFSFYIKNIHSSDIATLLDQQGIAVRSGHHCCQPLMEHFGIEGCVRISASLYNNIEDIQAFQSALRKAKEILF